MSIINRYFYRQLITAIIGLAVVLTGLAWMMQILSMLKFLMTYGISVSGFLLLTAMTVPFIISIIAPFVLFIATIFVYSRMIGDNEVTILAASGMSPARVARPGIMLALLVTALHLVLNIWTVPATQSKFYDTQWEMRYGLAHMKLEEGAFTQITNGLVIFVDRVSGYDLSQIMVFDDRVPGVQKIMLAEKGRIISTPRGLTVVASNGSLQIRDQTLTTGTFDTFDMDMEVADDKPGGYNVFKVRRISTMDLIRLTRDDTLSEKHISGVISEICTRLVGPWMDMVLVLVCVLILLKSSLLRRRASFAPVIAVAAMAVAQGAFMFASSYITTVRELQMVAAAVGFTILVLVFLLLKSNKQ